MVIIGEAGNKPLFDHNLFHGGLLKLIYLHKVNSRIKVRHRDVRGKPVVGIYKIIGNLFHLFAGYVKDESIWLNTRFGDKFDMKRSFGRIWIHDQLILIGFNWGIL